LLAALRDNTVANTSGTGAEAVMLVRMLVAAAALAAGPVSAVTARDLTVASRDGPFQEAQREVYFKPFTAVTGIPLDSITWEGGIDALRKQAKLAPNYTFDVVDVAGDELLLGCEEGLFEKLDWSQMGGKDHYLPLGVSDCGVGTVLFATVLAWNRDKLQAAPTWADFWDIAKYPGKRGLRKSVKGNLEFALMADGVAAGDVYKALRTSEGVDRAFRKLDQLRPYIVWWQVNDEPPKLLGSGDVLMTSSPNGRISVANEAEHHNFGIQWAGSLFAVNSWAVMKASPNLHQAYQFLYFAGLPALEARLVSHIPYSGLAKGANDGLRPDLLAISTGNPTNYGAGLQTDDQFWRDNADKLTQRFNAWLAH
jgi:putative spermidine/putrescine transport system substrate-binding protein